MAINASDLDTAVTLESQRTGVVEEPPFHVLVLGDFSADAEKGPLEERRPVEIDRDNFDEVIGQLGTRLDLELADGGILELQFAELDDFHPDAIFRSLPIFSELRELRKKLKDESTFYSAAREVRSKFDVDLPAAESAVEATPPADDLLGAILSQPTGGAPAPKTKHSSDIDQLVRDLVRPHLVSVDEAEQAGMLRAVDEATSGLMRAILHHRRFQELEAAWRGLYFLVRRTATSTELKLFLVDASQGEISDNLKAVSTLEETILYGWLIRDAAYDADPYALVAANYAFMPNVDDIAAMMRISKIAAVANAPLVAHMRPDVLGVHSLAEHATPREWDLTTNADAGKLWAALRGQDESKFLGMTIPRFLARLPYGSDTEPLETFNFEEFSDGPVHDQYCWANSAFVVAQLLADSFSSYGWEMGRALKQDVDGLPLHVYKVGTETVFKPCAEVLFTEDACDKLMNHGLMPLVSYKNTDHVKLARFQSIADPVTGLKGLWS